MTEHGQTLRARVWRGEARWRVAALAFLSLAAAEAGSAAGFPSFKSHEIARCGNKMGQTSLVDIDRDGDLDWVVGVRSGDVWWFEYQGPEQWVRHRIGRRSPTDVGGTAFDVDGDGWVDQVSGGGWYRNPGQPRTKEFALHANGAIRTHDNVAADIDGDGKLDVVAMLDSRMLWYRIPADATQRWEGHRIGDGVHGAVAPAGIGDLDGDGDNDVVRTDVWFENADGKGTRWVRHASFDFGLRTGSYPLTTKSWVVDLDRDGDRDVVMTECDCREGRAAWFENADGKAKRWTRHLIASTDQDLHSLAVADFDLDGDLDVFSGGGPLSKGQHRWIIWENADGKGIRWTERVVLRGKRCHEAVAGDVDGDGDVDICSKPWNGSLHVYLENLARKP
ncbi:VCBS repeat-containing protein [bacterium]|nr:VCBS repeat-containing protein [bacterium]